MPIPLKVSWIDKAKQIQNYHASKLKEDSHWTLKRTANELRMSIGSVSENLLIASWLKTHKDKLERFDYASEALEFIRDKKKDMMMDGVE